MNKAVKILTGIIVIIIVIAALVPVVIFLKGGSQFSVVALSNGDIYVGEFKPFPKPVMRQPWYLRTIQTQDGQNTPVLMKWETTTLWGAQSKISFARENILLWSRLRADSPIVQQMRANPQATVLPLVASQFPAGQQAPAPVQPPQQPAVSAPVVPQSGQ